jgi:hypothetical protein
VEFADFMWPLCWHWAAGYPSPEAAKAAGAYAEQKRQSLVMASCRFIDWIIVGGESGPGARPFDTQWARNTVEQCKAAGVACFVKQLGARPFTTDLFPQMLERGETDVIALKDKKGGDMSEWSEDLRVREFPGAAHA